MIAARATAAERRRSTTNEPLAVLVVEDSETDARSLIRQLRRTGFSPEWERVETAASLRNALRSREWSLVISDPSVPRLDAFDALALVRQEAPATPFIVLSDITSDEKVIQAVRSGAAIVPDTPFTRRLLEIREAERRRVAHELHDQIGQSLVAVRVNVLAAQKRKAKASAALAEAKALIDDCIEKVRRFSSDLYPTLEPGSRSRAPLSRRQREVLQLIVQGRSTRAIARQLQISVKTVETHRAHLMDRLRIHDVASLVLYAVRTGIVRAD